MVYEWSNTNLKYAQYTGMTEDDDSAITWYSFILGKPLPPLSEWKIPTLTQYISTGDKKSSRIISDCVSSASVHLISQKAVSSLKDIWDKHATLYPVLLDDKPNELYHMVVVHTVIDCIDRKLSIGTIHDWTEKGQMGLFDGITEWVMREEEIGDNYLFVLPDSPTAIYVTEPFKQKVLDAGLTGFGFYKARYFDDEPFIS